MLFPSNKTYSSIQMYVYSTCQGGVDILIIEDVYSVCVCGWVGAV